MNLSSAVRGAGGDKRLLKLLADFARRGPVTGFGFAPPGAERQHRRELALVCRLASMEPAVITACSEAGADAVELSAVTTTPATLAAVEETLTLPWGLNLREASYEAWESVLGQDEAGNAEWITVTMRDDARFLVLKDLTKLLEVDLDTRQETLRAISASAADVVIAVAGEDQTTDPLSIAGALRLRLLCDVLKQPVLITASLLKGEGSIRLAKECGAVGVLVESTDPAVIKAIAASLDPTTDAVR